MSKKNRISQEELNEDTARSFADGFNLFKSLESLEDRLEFLYLRMVTMSMVNNGMADVATRFMEMISEDQEDEE